METAKLSRAAGLDSTTECISSSLELFSKPYMDVSLDRCYYSEIQPTTAISDTANMISFLIPPSQDFSDLSESYVELKVQILKPDGTKTDAQAATDSYALINQPVSSLFSSVNVRLNDQLLSDSYGTHPYKAYLQTILNFGSDASARLELMGYVPDLTPTTMEAHSAAPATSFKKRGEWMAESNIRTFIGPIHHDLFNQNRLLIPLIPLHLDFIKVSDSFGILRNKDKTATDNTDYKFKITSMKLMIRRVKTTPSVKLNIERQLETKPAIYPLNQTSVKPLFIDANQKTATFENCFGGKGIPRLCLLMLCRQSAYRGAYKENPFMWEHNNLTSLKISFNGLSYPNPEFRPQYTVSEGKNWTREFYSLMNNTLKLDQGSFITYELFKKYYCIYNLDLGHFTSTLLDHTLPRQDVSARLDITFDPSQTNTAALVAMLYTEHDCELRITSSRSVEKDYIL